MTNIQFFSCKIKDKNQTTKKLKNLFYNAMAILAMINSCAFSHETFEKKNSLSPSEQQELLVQARQLQQQIATLHMLAYMTGYTGQNLPSQIPQIKQSTQEFIDMPHDLIADNVTAMKKIIKKYFPVIRKHIDGWIKELQKNLRQFNNDLSDLPNKIPQAFSKNIHVIADSFFDFYKESSKIVNQGLWGESLSTWTKSQNFWIDIIKLLQLNDTIENHNKILEIILDISQPRKK